MSSRRRFDAAMMQHENAGPQRPMAAANVSVASMVLVFDMVFSLWASNDAAVFQTAMIKSYSRSVPDWREILLLNQARMAAMLVE